MKNDSFWAREPGPWWSVATWILGILGLVALLLAQ
jgi:hypothetical protein